LNEWQKGTRNAVTQLEKAFIDWMDGIAIKIQDIVEKYPPETKLSNAP
jgi:hypothetical protein